MLRTIVWFGYFWGYMLLHLPALFKGEKALKAGDHAGAYAVAKEHVPHWANRLMELAGVQITVEGKENIPAGRPCVFVANHRGYYDIPLVLTQLGGPHPIVSKKEVEKLPLVNRWMKLLHCVFLDRNDARQSMRCLGEAADRVKQGYSVVIFPEGTRYKGEEGGMGEFKSGAFRIATKGNAPLVPVAICGSRALLEGDGRFIMKPGKVTVRILPPVETEGLDKAAVKELPAKLEAIVRTHVEELAAAAKQG